MSYSAFKVIPNEFFEKLVICQKRSKICRNLIWLKFSTDKDPKKSKTRCLTFLQKERVIKEVKLCDNKLPWVDSCKHLDNTIVANKEKDIRTKDIKMKKAAL